MDEFDLFAVKSKKANKSNSSVHFWKTLADHKLLSRLTDRQLFTVSPSRLQEHHGSYSFFNYKTTESKKYTMKFLVIWNVVIKTLTQFVQICRSLWISRQQHKIPDWVQMGFNFAGNQYLVSSMQQYSTATQQKLSSRSFAVPKLITSVALQHAKLTVYTKKETKGKTWTCTRYNKNKQAFI